jgi:hypothetical protein
VCGLRAYRRYRSDSDAAYWLLAGAGMLWLALDELQSVHERIGKWLWHLGWQAPAPFTHNDDALMFVVALTGFLVTAAYFRRLLQRPRAARLLLAGMAMTAFGIGLDMLALQITVEELAEMAAACILASAFAVRLHDASEVKAGEVVAGMAFRADGAASVLGERSP